MKKILNQNSLRLVLFLLATTFASAVQMELSDARLTEKASHIITGEVKRVYTKIEQRGSFEDTYYVAEIVPLSVEKGKLSPKGGVVYVRFSRNAWKGEMKYQPPGDHGQREIPSKGQKIKVYFQKAADGGYDVLRPNGLKIISQAKEKK